MGQVLLLFNIDFMDFEEKAYLISKITLGNVYFKYKGQEYKIVLPTNEQIYLSHMIYREEYNFLLYEDMLSASQTLPILTLLGKWNDGMDQEIKDTQKIIDKLKVRLFKRYLQKSEHPGIKRQIRGNPTVPL